MIPESAKETLWQSCRDKTCCSSYTVFLTGLDIWRIATTLRVPPWAFTVVIPSEDVPDAVILDNSGKRYRVALSKAPARKKSPAPCVFLTRLADGLPRCALGEGRPGPCRSFPAFIAGGLLCVMNDGGCTCRTWSLSDLDVNEETACLQQEAEARGFYYRVVASWNSYVRREAGDECWGYPDFCRYLLDVYAQLENRRAEEARAH